MDLGGTWTLRSQLPVSLICSRGWKACGGKGQSLPRLFLVIIASRSLLACWLFADVPYLVLQRPCGEFLESPSMWLAWLGFQSLESMMQLPQPHIKIMALQGCLEKNRMASF